MCEDFRRRGVPSRVALGAARDDVIKCIFEMAVDGFDRETVERLLALPEGHDGGKHYNCC
jgi:hypothetical protein